MTAQRIARSTPIDAATGVPADLDPLRFDLAMTQLVSVPGSLSLDFAVMDVNARLVATVTELQRELSVVCDPGLAGANALSDELTGLGNRVRWDQAIAAEAVRYGRYAKPFAIVMIDIDGLMSVNDTQGHIAGDELICLTAAVLSASARPSDTVARIGGDEFAILALECNQAGADALASRLRGALAAAGLRASLGAAVVASDGDAKATWAAADLAMYEARGAATTLAAV